MSKTVYRVKVFLSWSGEGSASHVVARGLAEWIPNVIQAAEPFLSSNDIAPGERWNDVLGRELDDSGFGILCLTKESLKSSWVTFEAGALAGGYKSASRVCPYLIDLPRTALTPPLSHFNAVTADKDGTFRMMQALNQIPGDALIREEILKDSFKMFWGQMERVLRNAKRS